MTEAGLNTINLSTLNTWQQIMLFLLIIIGSAIFVSAFVVHVRLRAFEDRFVDEIDRERRLRRRKQFAPLTRSFSRARSRSRVFNLSSTHGDRDEIRNIAMNEATSPSVAESGDVERGRRPTVEACDATIVSTIEPEPAATTSPLVSRRVMTQDSPDTAVSMSHLSKREASVTGNATGMQSAPELSRPMSNPDRISFAPDTRFERASPSLDQPGEFRNQAIHHLIPSYGVGARPISRSRTRMSQASFEPRHREEPLETESNDNFHHRFLKTGVLARNSTFHHMSENDRERLGGLEYKSVRLLAWLVPLYFVIWQLFGAIAIGAWIAVNRPATARQNGLNPWWVGVFNAISAFNNSGMSLLDANMVAFQTSTFMLISMGLLILAGNTCYPVFLRVIIWTMWKLTPDSSARLADFKCVLRFLLDHPRRVYTNLFPTRETWWLLATVIVLNGIDCAFFSILNIGNQAITYLNPGFEFLDGLFQAFAVRSGGFYVVPIPSTRISLQILYVVMMYISVYPVVITMRNSNVYEERSLGIYADDPGYDDYERQHKNRRINFFTLLGHGSTKPQLPRTPTGAQDQHGWVQRTYFIQQQLRAQLAHDLWWLVLAIWLIMIIEGGQFERDPATFSVFNVIFEVVSGYGTVGISVGVPDNAYSFSGSWHKLSKLILCAVMIRGRHRGLPVAIDKAIMLPRDGRAQADWEEEDARLRREQSKTRAGDADSSKAF